MKDTEAITGKFVGHAIDLLGVHTLHGPVPTTAPCLGIDWSGCRWLWRAEAEAAACESPHARGTDATTRRNRSGRSFAAVWNRGNASRLLCPGLNGRSDRRVGKACAIDEELGDNYGDNKERLALNVPGCRIILSG
jgi:hypothetical protein